MLLNEIYDNILACIDIITWRCITLVFMNFLEMVCHHKKGEIIGFLALDLTLINFNQLID